MSHQIFGQYNYMTPLAICLLELTYYRRGIAVDPEMLAK